MPNSSVKVNGNGNYTAGNDLTINNYHTEDDVLRFFDEDIKEVILGFSRIAKHEVEVPDDVVRVKVEDKNKKNGLSDKYFKQIKQRSMHYFEQIDQFLKSPINTKYLKMYEETIFELNQKITIHRDEYEKFDYIFERLFNNILEGSEERVKADRRLIWVFLHYMYWKCDIGEG